MRNGTRKILQGKTSIVRRGMQIASPLFHFHGGMGLKSYIAVMIGGGVGAFLRASVGWAFPGRDPWPTLVINLVGCLILGFFNTFAARSGRVSETIRVGFGTGVIGGFTTFSTFSVQSVSMMQHGEFGKMAAYLLLSLLGGLLMAWLGILSAHTVTRKAVRG
jgi:fluoride exporter